MASTKDNVKYVRFTVDVWAAEDGEIHLAPNDQDVEQDFKHTTLSNNENSKRYHPTAYKQFARLLLRYDKAVPGWEE